MSILVLKNAKVVTVTGKTYEKGVVVIENGRIKSVGANPRVPKGAKVLDLSGKWVTPGFIDAHSHISTMNEPRTMPSIPDVNEKTSPVTAQLRAIDSLNPFDTGNAAARGAGFTACCTLPGSANVCGGTGICFKTKAGTTVFDLAIPNSEPMKFAVGEKLTVMPFVETVWMDNRRFQSRYGGIPQDRFLGGAFATMTTGARLTWRIDDNWRLFFRFRQYDIINNQSRHAVKKQTAYYAKCDYPIFGAGIECSF